MTQPSAYPSFRKILPFIVSACITLVVMSGISLAIPDETQARSTFVVGIIAFFVTIAMPIYDINAWSLAKRTMVHLLAMIVTILPCLAYSGWFDVSTTSGVMLMLISFVGFGLISWIIGFAAYKVFGTSS